MSMTRVDVTNLPTKSLYRRRQMKLSTRQPTTRPVPRLVQPPATTSTQPDVVTLGELYRRWRQSTDFRTVAKTTQRQRDKLLAFFVQDKGHIDFKKITRLDILNERDRREQTPFVANNCLKAIRALFRWALDVGLRDDNPAATVRFFKTKTDGFRTWTAEDIERFRDCWPLGSRQRVAMEVILNTGLRRSDAVRLGQAHVRDGLVSIKTQKTGMHVDIPILPALEEAIKAGPVGRETFISRLDGGAFGAVSFCMWFRDACRAANVQGSAHGLRKAAATIMAEAGGTERELMAFFGWSTTSQSLTYTKLADKKLLAQQGAERVRQRLQQGRTTD